MARPVAVLGTLALFLFSLFSLVQHARAGDAFTFTWGKNAEQKRDQARELADFKLGEVARTLEGVREHTGSYWSGDVLWNEELRNAWPRTRRTASSSATRTPSITAAPRGRQGRATAPARRSEGLLPYVG